MSLDYAATAALMHDDAFKDRTKIACLHFASYIAGEDRSVPAHNTRMRWSQATFQAPDQSVALIMPALVMDAKVQEFGDAITDPDLQSAVEATVNSMI